MTGKKVSKDLTLLPSKPRPYSNGGEAVKALAGALQKLPDEWVVCRDVKHSWNVLNDFHTSDRKVEGGKAITLARELVCARCNTVRFETYVVRKYGIEKVSQSYAYPENYQIPGVPRGVKPSSIVQQEQYRRAMERVAKAARGESERSA